MERKTLVKQTLKGGRTKAMKKVNTNVDITKLRQRGNVSKATLARSGDVAERLDDWGNLTCHLLPFVGVSSS